MESATYSVRVSSHDLESSLFGSRRWLLEIVGFLTADYLAEKLRLKAARIEHLILCIDERRKCQDAEQPEGALVVRYPSQSTSRRPGRGRTKRRHAASGAHS